jgi:hypothetical protein
MPRKWDIDSIGIMGAESVATRRLNPIKNMKYTKNLAILALTVTGVCQSSAIELDFSNVAHTAARLTFNGNTDSFSFGTANSGIYNGWGFVINGSDSVPQDALGLLGKITGSFAVGSPTPSGAGQVATVTSSLGAQLIIDDGTDLFSGDINWIQLRTVGTGGNLNLQGYVNLTGISYSGLNSDLNALKGSDNQASATVAFTFSSGLSISDLLTDGKTHSTGYTGDLASVPEAGTTVAMLGCALLALGLAQRRFRVA